jgi:transcriptional regulator with XRE-family HTH domain
VIKMQGAGHLLREARKRAGLAQRELARRAGTAQSVVARIERDQSSPTWKTLLELIRAAGFELNCQLTPAIASDSHMLADVKRILSLTPEERLTEVRNVNAFLAAVHHA